MFEKYWLDEYKVMDKFDNIFIYVIVDFINKLNLCWFWNEWLGIN